MTDSETSYSGLDSLELVLVAPGRGGAVLLRTEFPRTIRLDAADARELARQLIRAAEVAEDVG